MAGRRPIGELLPGVKVLHDPERNKGTAFTELERKPWGCARMFEPFYRVYA